MTLKMEIYRDVLRIRFSWCRVVRLKAGLRVSGLLVKGFQI